MLVHPGASGSRRTSVTDVPRQARHQDERHHPQVDEVLAERDIHAGSRRVGDGCRDKHTDRGQVTQR